MDVNRDEQATARLAPIIEVQETAALAKLSPMEYDKVRKDKAEALEVRVETLDAVVKKLRNEEAQDEPPGLFPKVLPWPSEVDGAELLASLTEIFRRYLVLPEHADTAFALWVLFTHCIDQANVAPILALTSPEKRCGKTTVIDALIRLAHKPLPSSNITSAALFRAVEAWGPTLLIDEADSFLRESDELRGVINSGHTRASAFVVRTVEVAGNHEPRQFTTWGAKVIALIGNLPDTIADRSIRIEMQRKLPGQKVEKLRYARRELFEDLRSQCARFAKDTKLGIPSIPENLNDRAADNWESLLAIAEAAGGKWPDVARNAALALSGDTDESDSIRVQLLIDIKAIFEKRQVDRLSSAALVETLTAMEERPWPEYSHGKPLTVRQLAKLLKIFRIVPVSVRLEDGSTPKGYRLERFSDAFARYIPRSDPPQGHNPSPERVSGENASATVPPLLRIAKTPKPATSAACVGVADKKQEQGRAVGEDAISILRKRIAAIDLAPVEVRL